MNNNDCTECNAAVCVFCQFNQIVNNNGSEEETEKV